MPVVAAPLALHPRRRKHCAGSDQHDDEPGDIPAARLIFTCEREGHEKEIIITAALLVAAIAAASVFTHQRPGEGTAAPAPPPVAPIVAGVVAQHDVPIYLNGVAP